MTEILHSIAELRQKLSESMVRDTAMLEERTQLIGTLGTLLDAVNHASTEQRGAIDALLSEVVDVLEAQGLRLAGTVQSNIDRADRALCDMDLRLLPDGPTVRISVDIDPQSFF